MSIRSSNNFYNYAFTTEPIGFGNNYKPFGEPKFESCTIEFNANSQLQIITLYKVL